MQPLGTFEFYLCVLAAVVLPLIMLSQLKPSRRPIRSTTAYFRRERSKLSRTSLLAQGALAGWAMTRLAGHFGLMSASAAEGATEVAWVVFLAAVAIEIGLWARASWLRRRVDGPSGP